MNKLVAISLLLTGLFVVSDFFQRFIPSSKNNLSNRQAEMIVQDFAYARTDKQLIEINKLYKKYREPKNANNVNTVASKIDVTKQQGDLLTFFTDKSKLSLKAIVFDEKKYALIEIVNITDKSKKIEKFNDGDMLQGFTLSIANNRQVSLDKNLQHINLIMYRTKL
jgi:hypothetical protein